MKDEAITIKLPVDLKKKIKKLAETNDQTIGDWICQLLKNSIPNVTQRELNEAVYKTDKLHVVFQCNMTSGDEKGRISRCKLKNGHKGAHHMGKYV